MKPIGSAITTLQKEQSSKTGTPGGEHGLATQENSEVVKWLVRQRPEDTLKAIQSRLSSLGVEFEMEYKSMFPTGPNGESLPSYRVPTACHCHGTAEAREQGIEAVRKSMTPAPIRQIEAWIAELAAITASRKRDMVDAELMVNAFSDRLAQYPADVVKHALTIKTWKWFPTWEELEAACKPETIAALIAENFPGVSKEWQKAALDEATKGNCISDDGQP